MLTNTLQRLIGLKSPKYVGVSILGIDTMSVSTMLGSKLKAIEGSQGDIDHVTGKVFEEIQSFPLEDLII